MTITVKELIKYYLLNIDVGKIKNEEVKNALQSILETHEKELAEKEQEINSFKQQIDMAHNFNQNLGSEIEKLKQQQLFKEDFENKFIEYSSFDNLVKEKHVLKDNLKYDKLPSKDVK